MICDVIATGSQGNAVALGGEILIDCGVPYKKIAHIAPTLRLVLLTHRHADHFMRSTIKRLHRDRPLLRFGCCEWMVPHLLDAGVSPFSIDIYGMEDGAPVYTYGDRVKVCPFPLYHDVENCGYKITHNGKSVLYATDTATLDHVTAKAFDLYLIEANHTEDELADRIRRKTESGEYVYEHRVERTHLSRESADAWLAMNAGRNSQVIYLHQHQEPKGENK
jgi:L-ascorbate metabolism protein UlaG (beta-lactamase superfamily)